MVQEDFGPGNQPAAGDERRPAESLASVVSVERSEDIAAICGRVDMAPTWAVVIHAPDGNRQLGTELGMRRLVRHAEEAGKVVAIATRSSSLASRARQVGVPVSRRPESVRWDAGGRHVLGVGRWSVATPAIGRYVQIAIIAAVGLVAAGLVLTMAPAATVVAYPPTETVTSVVTITASEDITEVDLETLEVPASRVSGEQVITLALAPTGTVEVGVEPAKVSVVITNSTQADVVVAAGTVVLGGPAFFPFELDETVTVPREGSVSAMATAARPGADGNLAAGSVGGWLDEKFRFLEVTNPEAASGGLSAPRPAVDPQDVVGLQTLAKALESSATIKEGLVESRPHYALFVRTAETTVEYGLPEPPVGTPTDLVLLRVTVKVSALAVLAETLDRLARQVLQAEGGEGEFLPGTVTALETGARQLDATTGLIRTEVRLQGEFARGVTSAAVEEAVKGKSPGAARSTLLERYGIQEAEVKLTPGWAPWVPRFGFRVDVELRSHSADAATDASTTNDATTTSSSSDTADSGS